MTDMLETHRLCERITLEAEQMSGIPR
jgi:hypothetical protein